MLNTTTRISCGSLCRIESDGQFLLLLNRNRRQRGIYQLSPIGGAIEVENFDELSSFQYKLENPDKLDLRLLLASEEIDAFREWFYKRVGRETSPFREIYEELVEEEAVLPTLHPQDVRIRFRGIIEDVKATERKGATGMFTQYFLEIFTVDIASSDILLLLKSISPSTGVVWVNEAVAQKSEPIEMEFDGALRQVKLTTEYLFK